MHCSDSQKSVELLKSVSGVRADFIDASQFHLKVKNKEEVSSCMRILLDNEVLLYEWRIEEADLESMYLKITKQ